ncbi:MAG: DUF1559 domain-containing protein [Planctomycetes bacterium]|nr:DUF1559 domain-containing protein [Planctomycetota bacterium]
MKQTIRGRRGFTLVELLVVIAIIGVLVGLLLPAIQAARESSRRMSCVNNLRQQGLALQNHLSTKNHFPPAVNMVLLDFLDNANVMLLPYLEQGPLDSIYNHDVQWEDQIDAVLSSSVPIFNCPSSAAPSPLVIQALGDIVGDGPPDTNRIEYAATDYAYSKGVYDGWCIIPIGPGVLNRPGDIPRNEAGMFDVGTNYRVARITDGLSNTIAMGEASSDARWLLCEGNACGNGNLVPQGNYPEHAWNAWIVGEVVSTVHRSSLRAAGIYACTLEPMNKNPVTETYAFIPDLGTAECESHFPGNPNQSPANGSTTSNFRSNHPGGCNFLYGDGSVHYLTEEIGMVAYHALSTIAGEETVGGF